MTDDSSRPATSASAEQRKPLSPAAMRALAEAEARRQAARQTPSCGKESGVRGPGAHALWRLGKQGLASILTSGH